jgi:hypothetical protein
VEEGERLKDVAAKEERAKEAAQWGKKRGEESVERTEDFNFGQNLTVIEWKIVEYLLASIQVIISQLLLSMYTTELSYLYVSEPHIILPPTRF